MAVTAAVAAVGSLGASIHYQEKAASAQRNANRVANASQKAADRTALRQRQRETRIRQAQIMQSAQNTGIAGSSGAMGAFGALQTMYSANVAQQQGQAVAMDAISSLNQKAASYTNKANYASQISNLSMQALGQTQGFKNLFAQ